MDSLREVVPAASPFANNPSHESFAPFPDYPNDSHLPLSWYRHILWNHRWTVLAIALPVFLVSLFGTVRQKPTFQATGTLKIDMPRNSVTSLGELFQEQAAPDSYLQTQVQMLRSSLLVTRVIANLNPENLAKPTQAQVNDFQSRLTVEYTKGSPLIHISYESQSPQLAATLVNQLMALSIDATREQRSMAAQNASSWLLDQLNQTKTKLEQATVALARYELDHSLLYVETAGGGSQNIYNDRLQQLQTELTGAETDRIEKESIYKQGQAGDTSTLHSSVLDELIKKESDLVVQLSQISSKFGPNFPQVRQVNENLARVRSAESDEPGKALLQASTEYKVALRREDLLRQAFELQKKMIGGTSRQSLEHSILKSEVDLNRQVYDGLLKQMNEAGISSTFAIANARIVEAAQPPATQIRPKLINNLALDALIGPTLGVVFTFLQEHLLDRFRSEEDVQAYLNLPLLASIPAAPLRSAAHTNISNGNAHPHSNGNGVQAQFTSQTWFRLDRDGPEHFELSEAFRNLRTSLMFPSDGEPSRSVLISSAVPSEGKTTICANVSVALAQLGKNVLLIDGDLRRPSVHKVFSIKNDVGLTDYLQENRDWRRAVRPSGIKGLDVMLSGERPSNPAELLSSRRMRDLIRQAKSQYDIVVLDSPTLLHMADGRVLASYVEAVLLIVKSEATPRKLVKQACANLRSVTGKVMGVVLNQVDLHGEESSYSHTN